MIDAKMGPLAAVLGRLVLGLLGCLLVAQGALAQTPIKIGFGMSLTGPLSANGKAALIAMQLWAEETNAKGGLLGRKVELIHYDDQSNPSTVPGIYSKLLDVDKVDLITSGYGTNVAAPAVPIAMQRNLTFMALFALGTNEKFKYDRYFQITPSGPTPGLEFSKGFLEVAMSMNPKPQSIALVGADAEYPAVALGGARENVKKLGLKLVYDRTYPPATTDYTPIVRAIQAANPDVVFIASYPADTAGLVRAINEVKLKARMLGGGMVGLQFAALKGQLGPLMNGITSFDFYVPEPTLKFPGIEEFLAKYRPRAVQEKVDLLGIYVPPFAYAAVQVLGAAVQAAGSLDQGKIAEKIKSMTFDTIVGKIKFGSNGEWETPRILQVQYQGIQDGDLEQFKKPGRQIIVYPPNLKSGEFKYPFSEIKR
ncbi:MAG: amino acid ABC transporter substrate-binding protein [Burkholderiales bacterium]